jgi:DNA topoisomerase-1
VDTERDFEPKYITIRGKGDILANLRKLAKTAKKIYLATDPDREGEAISWHLMHALKLDTRNTERITFNEITSNAVKKSLKEARAIDMDLVDAQQARRVLDRVVGYKISPLLWKKVRKGLSAGRVQSVVLKLICEREEEIELFNPEEYWTLEAKMAKGSFIARYHAASKNVTAENGKHELKTEADVQAILKKIKDSDFTVREVKQGTRTRKPPAPFTTSTLQQEASRLFAYAPSRTMRIAQQLYEGVDVAGEGAVGLVTYIRTDSPRISDDAYGEAVRYIQTHYAGAYIPSERWEYKTRGRTQDAHEAIRPTSAARTPDALKASLSGEQYKLYKLIWERFIGSQMAAAVYETLSVKLEANKTIWRASGSLLTFDGYLAVYSKNEDAEKDVKIPSLKEGEVIKAAEFLPVQHFTQPPPRYSEGSMVRTMEDLGIGRPGTFAQTIMTLLVRGYVTKENKVLYPTELGEIVNEIMTDYFENIVDTEFTARMEDDLDRVELGEFEWKDILRNFYPAFAEKIHAAEELIGNIEVKDEVTDIPCENCNRLMVIKFGRFGKFLACPGFPECRNAKPILEEAGVACPLCGGSVVIKKSKKGRTYYGCDAYPGCDFISWNLPTGEKCPDCNSYLIIKGRKNRVAACSACKFTKEAPEETE